MAKILRFTCLLVILALTLSLGMVTLPVAEQVMANPGTTYYVNADTGSD